MRPTTITLTGTGSIINSDPVPVDWRSSETSLGLNTDGSTTGFTVQYSLDDPTSFATPAAWNTDGTWYSIAELTARTVDTAHGLDKPVRGIRLQADAVGTDTAILTIVQADD